MSQGKVVRNFLFAKQFQQDVWGWMIAIGVQREAESWIRATRILRLLDDVVYSKGFIEVPVPFTQSSGTLYGQQTEMSSFLTLNQALGL